MKNLFKGFSIKEVIIISVLLLFLLGVAYYQFVDSPVYFENVSRSGVGVRRGATPGPGSVSVSIN